VLDQVTEDAVTPAERVLRSLARLELAVIRQRGGVSRRLGVRDDELTVLLYLAEHGGMTQASLASLTALSRSGVGAMVQRLERAGLLERYPEPDDKRIRLIRLSPRATERIRDAYRDRNTEVGHLLDHLPARQVDELERFLAGLADATEASASERSGEPVLEPVRADPIWRLWG
jgi:MarR family transcriptional regulator for hemolysin